MGVEVTVEGLTKSFGSQNIWRDVSLTLPAGEVNALLGPSGTGKSVFLKTLIGLLHPEQGKVIIDGTDITQCSAKELYEIRKLFGVLFQDGALFGSMSLYDNIAFPLREHTKKKEDEIRKIVLDKVELVGLAGAEDKLPGEISGGMRKRAGLARALVLDPQIILCDEPDSGLDPVRTAYISQLLIDINAEIDATILIVTHNINIARTIPDNIGMLFRKELVMFGPREVLLTSEQPVVKQFLSGDRFGPIGMSEEKDESVAAAEAAMQAAGISGGGTKDDFSEIIPQVQPNPGMPVRKAAIRHRANVLNMLHELPDNAQEAIRASMAAEDRRAEEAPETSATLVALTKVDFDQPDVDKTGLPGGPDAPDVEIKQPEEILADKEGDEDTSSYSNQYDDQYASTQETSNQYDGQYASTQESSNQYGDQFQSYDDTSTQPIDTRAVNVAKNQSNGQGSNQA